MNKDVFSQVASSGLDFIEFGIDNVDVNPKQSLISFYTAVELLLKARLLVEHWSLIVMKPESASLERFNSGDFQSVGLDQLCSRLKNIANDGISDKSLTVFVDLKNHRNKIVHFTHAAFLRNSIALQAEQLRTWVHLHTLLKEKWGHHFIEQADRIEAIQAKMLRRGEYISECFNHKEADILKHESNGESIVFCEFCEKRAGIVLNRGNYGIKYSCNVCDTVRTSYDATTAKIDCPQCKNAVEFFHNSITECSICRLEFDEQLLTATCSEQYGMGDPDYHDSGDKVNIYCDMCSHDKPTVFYIDGMWSCIACHSRGYAATNCIDCGVEYYGNTQELQSVGCHLCAEQYNMYSHIDEDAYNEVPEADKAFIRKESDKLKAKIKYRQNQ